MARHQYIVVQMRFYFGLKYIAIINNYGSHISKKMIVDNTSLLRARIKILSESKRRNSADGWEFDDEEGQVASGSTDGVKTKQIQAARPTRNFSLYSAHARQVLADVNELRDLILDRRKEYILCSSTFSIYGAQKFMSDTDRKKFDRETDMAIKQCTKLIRDLELQVNSDQSLQQVDEQKHLSTVVSMLGAYLKDVIRIVAQFREIHVRKKRQIRKICRLANLVEMHSSRLEEARREEDEQEERLQCMKRKLKENEKGESGNGSNKENKFQSLANGKPQEVKASSSIDGWDDAADVPDSIGDPHEEEPQSFLKADIGSQKGWAEAELDVELESLMPNIKQFKRLPSKLTASRPAFGEIYPTPLQPSEPLAKAEQSQLLAENKKLFERFTTSDAELQRIESHMEEIQKLQNMFAEKIGEQDHDIETIHSRTVYTLDNLETANEFIREAIKNQANRRVIMIFCLLVLTFTLLFLDWYNL